MRPFLRSLVERLASLRLTVVLLILGMVLVVIATLDQVNLGIWAVQTKYFRSFFVFQQLPGSGFAIPFFPGGYLIGGALLLNLLCAQFLRFTLTWRNLGLHLTHFGIALLLVGELITGLLSVESHLTLDTGETRNYAEAAFAHELAIVDTTDPAFDQVWTVPLSRLARREPIALPGGPLTIIPTAFHENAQFAMRGDAPNAPASPATLGFGPQVVVQPSAPTYRPNEQNLPTAFVEIRGADGVVGTMLATLAIERPQEFTHAGRTYTVALRPARIHLDFALTLIEFRHDKYPGTQIPRNFSSQVRLRSADGKEDREVRIFMNNPLRHGGYTFYQSGFKNNDRTTVLQVVRNPGWLIPYIACVMSGFGLLLHFCITLAGFLARRQNGAAAPASSATPAPRPVHLAPVARYLPLLAGLLALAYVASTLRLPANRTGFDTEGFGRLPVLLNGRLKPLDTVARTSLLLLQNKQRVKTPAGTTLTPHQWLLDAFFRPEVADTYKTFRIDNNEVLALLRLTTDDGDGGVRFAFAQLEPHLEAIEQQAERASRLEAGERNAYEREIVKLHSRLLHYVGLRHSLQLPRSADFAAEVARFQEILPAAVAATQEMRAGREADSALVRELAEFVRKHQFLDERAQLLAIPPPRTIADPNAWTNLGQALLGAIGTGEVAAPVREYAALGRAWRLGNTADFNRAVSDLHRDLVGRDDPRLGRASLEFLFNHAQPFYGAAVLYVLSVLVAFVSWLAWPVVLSRAALSIGFVAWMLTTAGIAARMYIESRPPVTNLYSSALFVGWVGAGLALVIERLYRNSVGNVVAGAIGFVTLIVAHNLSFSGDTMEMMRAVLDSNFWLATHVVTITMGYGACFLAGALGLVFVVRGALTRSLDRATADSLLRMTYGAICFATLFSLVGTVLGGIWADQSWGRFWGWDPKENGALVIVLWCAVILHARWGKLVGPRGFMNLAIFGNCITAASWFGVNMLNVGLHSYGFMDSAFFWLCVFWASQLAVIALGCLPAALWRSRAAVET